LESPAHRPAALDALRRDYGRLTGSRDDVGWLRLYLETLRNSAFGAVLVFRVLSSVVGSRVRFHGLRLLMNLLVPRRRDIEISPLAVIGEGLVIFHGSGLVIGSGVKAGKNLSLEHGVTLGNRIGASTGEALSWPVLGDGCFVGCGAAVLGPVRLGNNARVGANAVVLCDVPDDCTAVGVPARVVSRTAGSAASGT
jgi:serine O-acetyltransferase